MKTIAIEAPSSSWVPIQDVESVVTKAGARLVDRSDAEGLIWLDSFNAVGLDETLQRASSRLEWVQLPWAGVEVFVQAGLFNHDDRSIVFTCAKGAYGELVGEHVLTLTLALLRNIKQCATSDTWIDWQAFSAETLFDKNVLILGGGGIAQNVIRLMEPFRVSVSVIKRHPAPMNGTTQVASADDIHELLPKNDIIILALPLTPETTGIIGESELALMTEHSLLINVGRGQLIDTNALVTALSEHRIGAAALDVTEPEPLPDEHPLWTLSNCLITPHVGDPQSLSRPYFLKRLEENVIRFINGRSLLGKVDPALGY